MQKATLWMFVLGIAFPAAGSAFTADEPSGSSRPAEQVWDGVGFCSGESVTDGGFDFSSYPVDHVASPDRSAHLILIDRHGAPGGDLLDATPVAKSAGACAPCEQYPGFSGGFLTQDVCFDDAGANCATLDDALDECLAAGLALGWNCCNLYFPGADVCTPRRGGGCCCDWACYCQSC